MATLRTYLRQQMKTPRILSIFCILGMTPSILVAASSPDALFQEALVQETGERNLEKAIELYKQVILQGDPKALLTGNARLRIGACYERLRKPWDALAAYQEAAFLPTTPSELRETAQSNVVRLQAQLQQSHKEGRERETVVVVQRTPAEKIAQPFEIDADGARTFFQNKETTHYVVWGSLSYALLKPLKVGLEGGYFLPRNTNDTIERGGGLYNGYDIPVETDHNAFYIGPFVQGSLEKKPWSLWLRGGVGPLSETSRLTRHFPAVITSTFFLGDIITPATDVILEQTSTLAAFSLSSGMNVNLTPWVGLGAGVRTLTVFGDTDFSRFIFLPFGRVFVQF